MGRRARDRDSSNGTGFTESKHFGHSIGMPEGLDMDLRGANRHRVLKAGTIEFGGSAINCMIRNLSNSGAALDVASPVGIPDHFTLVLQADGHHAPCHVIWRKEKRIGIAFD
jgi:hypothetical protein